MYQSNVRHFSFNKKKYGPELLVDIGRLESLAHYVRSKEPHTLDFYEIAFITSGSGSFMLDDHEMEIKNHQIIFTSPFQVRKWLSIRPVKGFTLFFEHNFLNSFFVDPLFLYRFPFFNHPSGYPALSASKELFGISLQNLVLIEKEFSQLQNDSIHLIRAYLYQLLILLSRTYAATQGFKTDTQLQTVVFKFRQLIERHFKNKKTVQEYSRLLKITPGHLNKLCVDYFGKNASHLIKERIHLEAQRLVLYSGKSIAEIAYELNYSDPSNFSRFFKSMEMKTPVCYYKQIVENDHF